MCLLRWGNILNILKYLFQFCFGISASSLNYVNLIYQVNSTVVHFFLRNPKEFAHAMPPKFTLSYGWHHPGNCYHYKGSFFKNEKRLKFSQVLSRENRGHWEGEWWPPSPTVSPLWSALEANSLFPRLEYFRKNQEI